jgi:hypothetical protein
MTPEGMAAVVGISAGVGSFVGGWVALWWRDRVPFGQRQLLRHVYRYVDDRIGATRTEHIRRAQRRHIVINKRRWYWWLVPKALRRSVADYFWPVPQLGTGIAALPSTKRMGRYVQIECRGDRPAFRKPYQLWNIQAVILWPTSEVDVHTGGFEPVLARWVAWAMRLAGPEQLEVEARPELGYWRLARRGPAREPRASTPHAVGADV